mmetsp:Transcript_1877/g.5599  ORF Transcript_1877/g.5599 Transcript_1877/m.5599 type:complete len:433 (+) Transcript_1877:740-2038(+)
MLQTLHDYGSSAGILTRADLQDLVAAVVGQPVQRMSLYQFLRIITDDALDAMPSPEPSPRTHTPTTAAATEPSSPARPFRRGYDRQAPGPGSMERASTWDPRDLSRARSSAFPHPQRAVHSSHGRGGGTSSGPGPASPTSPSAVSLAQATTPLEAIGRVARQLQDLHVARHFARALADDPRAPVDASTLHAALARVAVYAPTELCERVLFEVGRAETVAAGRLCAVLGAGAGLWPPAAAGGEGLLVSPLHVRGSAGASTGVDAFRGADTAQAAPLGAPPPPRRALAYPPNTVIEHTHHGPAGSAPSRRRPPIDQASPLQQAPRRAAEEAAARSGRGRRQGLDPARERELLTALSRAVQAAGGSRRFFRALNTAGGGRVVASELYSGLREHGVAVASLGEAQRLLDEHDLHHEGSLTYADFVRMLGSLHDVDS